MMCFGFSGSPRRALFGETQQIVTGSNKIRAAILVGLVEAYQIVVRTPGYSRRGYGGKREVYAYPNPAVEAAIKGGYTYPSDWAATYQAFYDWLVQDCDLLGAAEAQGITTDAVAETIERILGGEGEWLDA